MQVAGILFNSNPKAYTFETKEDYNIDDKVVVETSRGIELGRVAQVTKDYIQSENEDIKPVLRKASSYDIQCHEENLKKSSELISEIKKNINDLKLNMKVCQVEYTLDRSKIIISYTAEDRVDFRELIKVLGSKFKTRVEMRQVGSRDEVQYIGALGICGRECCCKSFLGDFDKVSIKMAKNQGLALNPTKINGACGRLLCCLKYEDDFYKEIMRKMPKINSFVETPDGKAKVLYSDLMKEKVTVLFEKEEDSEKKEYDLKDLVFSRVIIKDNDDDENE
ncbi:MAG: regulatory iron-sulfur-containing complex subunit RicT [Clostridia bacterium]|nr:regulatory iron-sulfur-containing complex subunit RicT [Clostridia bacterium]